MELFGPITFLFLFIVFNDAVVVTTTLSPAEQTSAAVINQEAMLQNIIEDIFESTSLLQYITSADYDVPTSFISFMVEIYSYSATEFPTSIFVSAFPFEEFKGIFSRLPDRENIISSYSVTDLKVPSDYAVLTITETSSTIFATKLPPTTSSIFSQVKNTGSSYTVSTLVSITNSASVTTKSSNFSSLSSGSASEIISIGTTTFVNGSNSLIIPTTFFVFLIAFAY